MRCRLPAATAAAAAAAALAQPARAAPPATYNFLAIGDWGDDGAGQRACAAGMGAVAAEIGAAQVFALGDNFYSVGIQPDDGPDGELRFKKTFEDVYTAPSLQIPFWAVAGNHDWHGNVSAQIAYSQNPQNVGGRWRFPNWWYNVTQRITLADGKSVELEVLLFDSVIMVGNSEVLNDDGSITDLSLSQLQGSADPDKAAEQLAWLEDRMNKSTADYLWVGGHYPVWAIGQDPPTGVRSTLRAMLDKWEAHYFNGHEHDLEHIVENSSKVNYVSTGAGKMCCYKDTNLDTVPVGSIKFAVSGSAGAEWRGRTPPPFNVRSGFTSYRIGADSMKVYFHSDNGTVLYTTPPILPRTKKAQPPVGPPGSFCTVETCPATDRPTGPPPPPPPPPAPTPAGMTWDCHAGMEADGLSGMQDHDLTTSPFGVSSATLETCEGACNGRNGCVVVNWHQDDYHCHVLSGTVTTDDFLKSLQEQSGSTACMLVKGTPPPAPTGG